MADIFSLGRSGTTRGRDQESNQEIPEESWLLHKNIELWQQHQQQQRDPGVGPTGGGDEEILRRSGYDLMTTRATGGGGGGMSCQDCGNKAKKDCVYMRCRTCCKTRGFDCSTHVKSTWVPAAKRRERHHQLQLQLQLQLQGGHPSAKRHRDDNPSSSSLLYTRLPNPGMGVASFPAEVSTEAVFRRVRVSSMEEGGDDQDQVAYQTEISIGGHVFKGLLHHQGSQISHSTSTSSPAAGAAASGSSSSAALVSSQAGALTFVDPAFYPAAHRSSLGGFYGGFTVVP